MILIMRLLAVLVGLAVGPAYALEVVEVAPRVYALVGDTGQRSPDNLGNNATFGAVVTEAGVVLIDSGGSTAGAQRIEQALRQITPKPVVLVINTGGQDHRWLGNDWFKARGARIIASAAAVADQTARSDLQFAAAQALIGPGFDGTHPIYADETFSDIKTLTVGEVRLELRRIGPAHTPGDSLVWLPDVGVVFAGDVVFVDRMLGVLPYSSAKGWLAAFEAMAALNPTIIVPGHGHPTDLAKARAQTFDYLTLLRGKVGALVAAGGDLQAASAIDQTPFLTLPGAGDLAGRNAGQVFTEMEFE